MHTCEVGNIMGATGDTTSKGVAMAEKDSQRNALQVIFSIFLGLMLATFVGIGVWTFYPPPEYTDNQELQTEIRKLELERDSLYSKENGGALTPSEQQRVAEIDTELQKLYEDQNKPNEAWGRNTSIILITFATIVMAISLVQAEQLKVLSNGLLLGGIFTMIYGTGWAIATGTSQARFWVVAAALVITIGLGYARFVRIKKEQEEDAGAIATTYVGGAASPELAGRVSELERKMSAIAEAFNTAK